MVDSPKIKPGSLNEGATLTNGEYILSKDGQYRLQLLNGKLTEYGPDGSALWSKDVTEKDVGTEGGVYSSDTEDPNTTLTVDKNGLTNSDGTWIDLGHARGGEWSTRGYALQPDGNFVAYDTSGATGSGNILDSTNKTGKVDSGLIDTPLGASDSLKSLISTMNTSILPASLDKFGNMSKSPTLPFTEETKAPANIAAALNPKNSDGSGAASDAYQKAKEYVAKHDVQWNSNDADLRSRTQQLVGKRTYYWNLATGVIDKLNGQLQAAAVPGGKPGSIKNETDLVKAINNGASGVSEYSEDYQKYSDSLAPANAIWPDGGTGPHDSKGASGPSGASGAHGASGAGGASGAAGASGSHGASGSGQQSSGDDDSTGDYGTGNSTGTSGSTGTTGVSGASDAATTDYSSLFGNTSDGAVGASGASEVSDALGGDTALGASGSDSDISSELDQLQSDLADDTASSDSGTGTDADDEMSELMQSELMSRMLNPSNAQNGLGASGDSGDSEQNSQSANPAQNGTTSTQSGPAANAVPAAAAAPPAVIAPAAAGVGSHMVSVNLDGETQHLPSVVADAINKELNNPNGCNAIDAYQGTSGENTSGQPWQQIDDLSKLQTGDVVQWHDRSALVVHDDKGLHMIVDGHLVPLTQQTTQSPPQDAYGAYGDFQGFYHPSGANLNSSGDSQVPQTAAPNPPAVTAPTTTTATPPKITPPKTT